MNLFLFNLTRAYVLTAKRVAARRGVGVLEDVHADGAYQVLARHGVGRVTQPAEKWALKRVLMCGLGESNAQSIRVSWHHIC